MINFQDKRTQTAVLLVSVAIVVIAGLALFVVVADKLSFDYNLSGAAIPTNILTLKTPNGGEVWRWGQTQSIRWAYGVKGSGNKVVNIWLIAKENWPTVPMTKSLTSVLGTKVGVDIATGRDIYEWKWVIPNSMYQIISSDNYYIKVEVVTDLSTSDESNAPFSIRDTYTVTTPNGGELWYPGENHNIVWSTTDGPNVHITAKRLPAYDGGDAIDYGIYTGAGTPLPAPPGSGLPSSYYWTWKIPSDQLEGQYIIQVLKLDNQGNYSQSDFSDNSFSISKAGIVGGSSPSATQ